MTHLVIVLVSALIGSALGSLVTYKVVTAHVEQVFSRFLEDVSAEAEATDDAIRFSKL